MKGRSWYLKTPKEHIEDVRNRKNEHFIPKSTIRWMGGRKGLESLTNRQKWMKIIKERGLDRCSRCGYNRCFDAIDFHHTDPTKKREQISSLMNMAPSKGALSELDRCVPLCRNCHAEVHHERGKKLLASPVKYIKPDEIGEKS